MRKFILMFLLLVTLSGCGFIEEKAEIQKIDVTPPKEYELTSRQYAYMYNGSVKKLFMHAKSGNVFTYMIPEHHTYSQVENKFFETTDAHLHITSPFKVDSKEKQLGRKITYTFDYLTSDMHSKYRNNYLYQYLLNKLDGVLVYDTKAYSSYNEYVTEYKNSLNDLIHPVSYISDDIVLTGQKEPIKANVMAVTCKYGDSSVQLPVVTYDFCLKNGDYLRLTIQITEPEFLDVCNPEKYYDLGFKLDKPLKKQLSSLSSLYVDYNSIASDIMNYVIIGDYSFLIETESDETVWKVIESNPVKIDVDDKVEFFDTQEESEVISSVDEPANDNYYDYSTDTTYFFE